MNYRYKIVDINEVPSAWDFLTPSEAEVFQTFPVKKRAQEWLAGRYALKKLATDFFTFPMSKMQVKNKKNGTPVLLVEGGTKLPVSITHRGIYAAAAISLVGNGVGIDIEEVEERPKSWVKQYFVREELSSTSPAYMTELWAKKEAVLKYLQLGLTVPATDIRIIQGQVHFFGKALDVWALLGSPKIKFEVKNLDGGYKFVLAFEAPVF